ncbi:unnamed protein product [Rotaria sordida]|uniref:peptidyl-tRNA hydrolase n=1 Tax=Rotaria sordida TaxID=392033 RepID=A0A813UXB7_9BILA|nr:unnamed protein product [Rotaria sordida]CAF0798389.1 unnamed protein product [Rotaria sordida]CAF0829582.1 unnamed protein product [Rotaria sordida]CAF0836136.1 unnamed protein product [Rotaria sordida]CAF0837132.1 unnamed protein product [Rotaria sordida]
MQNASASNTTADNLAVLIDMGFSEQQSREALQRVENLEDAIAFLLNDQVQPSPPSSPGVSQPDTSDDEASYAANPRCMQFIINTGHPHLSFSACLLNIAQASFDLYDQIMSHRSQLLSFKTWHHHGEFKQLFECNNGNQLRELNHLFEMTLKENQICTALIYDTKYHEPVCLAVFGIASYLEQYTSQLKRLHICPTKFFINDNDDDENINNDENISETTKKQ